METLSRKVYKIKRTLVDYNTHITIFMPTTKVSNDGQQLWQELNNEGLMCDRMWTEFEITTMFKTEDRQAYEIPNPREEHADLIHDLRKLHEENEWFLNQCEDKGDDKDICIYNKLLGKKMMLGKVINLIFHKQ